MIVFSLIVQGLRYSMNDLLFFLMFGRFSLFVVINDNPARVEVIHNLKYVLRNQESANLDHCSRPRDADSCKGRRDHKEAEGEDGGTMPN